MWQAFRNSNYNMAFDVIPGYFRKNDILFFFPFATTCHTLKGNALHTFCSTRSHQQNKTKPDCQLCNPWRSIQTSAARPVLLKCQGVSTYMSTFKLSPASELITDAAGPAKTSILRTISLSNPVPFTLVTFPLAAIAVIPCLYASHASPITAKWQLQLYQG